MNIDGSNLRIGRLSTVVAKAALLGNEVNIFNVEKIIITGDKKKVFEKYKQRRERGAPLVGPYYPRIPSKFVKRCIRGMLPYKQTKGRDALDRVKCHKGVPAQFKETKLESIPAAHIDNSMVAKFTTVGEVCKLLGGKEE